MPRFADVADQYVASVYTGADAANQLGTVSVTSADLAYTQLRKLKVKLDEANVAQAGRYVIVPPWYHGLLLENDKFVRVGASGTSEGLRNGAVGRTLGFDVLVSNNAPLVTGDDYAVMAGYPGAISFAEQTPRSRRTGPSPRSPTPSRACTSTGPSSSGRPASPRWSPPSPDRHRRPPTVVGVAGRSAVHSHLDRQEPAMARTAVTVTTFTANAGTTNPTGTTADPDTDHVISGVPAEELLIRFANTNGTDRVATIVAGDNRPPTPPARATSTSPSPPRPVSSGSARSPRLVRAERRHDPRRSRRIVRRHGHRLPGASDRLMADTRFFRSASGVIYEMDVPAVGSMRRERHDEKVANGELVELIGVTPVRVDVDDTSYRWELPKGTAPAAIPAPEPVDLLEDDAPAADDGDDPAIDGDDVPDGTIGDILAWSMTTRPVPGWRSPSNWQARPAAR